MSVLKFSIKLHLLVVLFCSCLAITPAQDEKKSTFPNESTEKMEEDVIKISTDLIQMGVAVFNKQGQFIKNLKREDFELFVDGKPVPISFFEQNTAKSRDDEAKIGQESIKSGTLNNALVKPVGRSRNIIFVVDDLHLSFDSHYRIKKLLLKFIEQEMISEDTVAIISSTGKIGFLQQFTNDKTVLRTSIERLIFNRDRSANDRSMPPMTEYEALLISQFDRETTDIFAVQEVGDIESKREVVRSRARIILTQANTVNRRTYLTLEQAIRNSAQLTGRKVVFFISDGFLLDPSNSDSSYRLRRITDAAARTNAVIYSFDAKGLEAGFPEGTSSLSPNGGFRVQSGERFERQDGLSLLADETGGRFIKNTNDLQTGLTKSIEEASQYYLLAWEPVSENGNSDKLRKIEIRVKDRPELKILVQSGYLDESPKSEAERPGKTKNKQSKENQPPLSIAEQQLNRAVSAPITVQQLPTFLAVNYLETLNEGALLAAAMQFNSDAVEFTPQGDKAIASVDIVGVVYDSNGKREGYFRQHLNVDIPASKLTKFNRPNIYYNYQVKLKPGLYQVRVAGRDVKSGRVGSAVQWIEIPDLLPRKLTLSSLILSEQIGSGEKLSPENAVANAGALELPVSVDRRFARSSKLRYIVFVYNAVQRVNQPEITLQTQIFRGQNLIIVSAMSPISAEGQDPARLPYLAEISLDKLLPGRYELQITVQDRISKNAATRRVSFEIE